MSFPDPFLRGMFAPSNCCAGWSTDFQKFNSVDIQKKLTMKNFLSLLLTMLLSMNLMAQIPDGSIAPNFTATDLDGNQWTLYDILDQGKQVILSINATWAGPNWNYHQSGALQDFYEQHGPAGDNTAMVLWVEADATTNLDCIYGSPNCGAGTQGDWTAGQTYPMFEDPNNQVFTSYQIGYYPTIFMICSDKIVKEAAQLTAPNLSLLAADCPVVTQNSKLLIGTIGHDLDGDCAFDAGETGGANWFVTATGQDGVSRSTLSLAGGAYRMWVDSIHSPFTMTFSPPNNLWTNCALLPPVATISDTTEVNHVGQVAIECTGLTAQIGLPFLRRCFLNKFDVDVCNEGTETADSAYVDITLQVPEILPITAATLNYDSIAPGIYRFQLGDIAPGECVSFDFWAKVSCDSTATLGETVCFEAHAYPDTICDAPTALWNGATVAILATCNAGQPGFSIKNVGYAPMLAPSNYIVIEDDVMHSEGEFQLNPGEMVPITLPGNGSTWRIEALQVPNHPIAGIPAAALEGCTDQNTFSTGYLLNFPVFDPTGAQDIECLPIIGAFDPNDKTGIPLGVTNANLILKNTDIEYLVRFQNTGNDTAFTVVVRDTLSPNLDAKTIRLGTSSHAFELQIENENVLVFNFNNIQLVDSFKNEAASHGYFKYKISQKPDLADGTVILNSAAIYFDFNEPVITNTTLHRIGHVPHVTISTSNLPVKYSLQVFPNPLDNSLALTTETEMPLGTNWVLYDFSGKKIGAGQVEGRTLRLENAIRNDGIYRIEFFEKNGGSLGGATIVK